MARSRSISADYQPSKRLAPVVESSSEAEEPIEERPSQAFIHRPSDTPKDGQPSSSSRHTNGSTSKSTKPSGTSIGGLRRSTRFPEKRPGPTPAPLFLDDSSPDKPSAPTTNGHQPVPARRLSPRKAAQPLPRPQTIVHSRASISGVRARKSSPLRTWREDRNVDEDGEAEQEEVEEFEGNGPGRVSTNSRDTENQAGPSMSRVASKTSRLSSDPLALRSEEEDQLRGTDRRDPIEIMDDSRFAPGSRSDIEPSRTKRRRIQSPSMDHVSESSRWKGKGKAIQIPQASKSKIVVELPVLPLHTLKTYHVPEKYKRYRPDQISRVHLPRPRPLKGVKQYLPLDERDRRRNTFKERLKARQTLDPDGTFADVLDSEGSVHWQESEEDETDEDDGEMCSDSESDSIALRRSRRAGYKAPERKRPKTRASRAMDKLAGNHTISRLTTSSISEESFYGTSAPHSRLPRNMRPLTRGARRTAQVVSDSEEDTRGRDDDLELEDRVKLKTKRNGWAVESEGEEEMHVDSGSVYGDESDQLDETEDEGRDSGDDALRRHRAFCEKCARQPANEILAKAIARKKKPGKRRRRNEDELSDEELANEMEGWLECSKCVISSHWGCLAATQQKDVLYSLAEKEGPPKAGERRRKSVRIDERSDFVCTRCTAHPECFVCHSEHVPSRTEANAHVTKRQVNEVATGTAPSDDQGENASEKMDVDQLEESKPSIAPEEKADESESALLFRCHRCKLACHYVHLKDRPGDQLAQNSSLEQKAEWYQSTRREWTCHQCRDWIWPVDIICAWRPLPADAVEERDDDDEPPSYRDPLPREYLVKWIGRGFRHVTWIPHAWLLALANQKLRNFLEKGPSLDLVTDETLEFRGDDMAQPTIASVLAEDDKVQGHRASHSHLPGRNEWKGYGPAPDVDAANSIPQEWSTIDRVLDIMLLPPVKGKQKARPVKRSRILSASASPAPDSMKATPGQVNGAILRPDGLEPPEEERMDIDTWEDKSGRTLKPEDVDEVAGMVTWCFVKWDDLQYDQSTWDTPPPTDSVLYPAFKRALKRHLGARLVEVPVLSTAQAKQCDMAAQTMTAPPEEQPDCIVGGTLMPFQMQGFQWLLYKHFKRESCILADDMGLGKTIQIASLLGYLGSNELQVYPCLVVVPNSTITNWVREFEKWVPHMRVVPYYGEASSRKIISKYELYRKGQQGKAAGLKAHVVLTTYDMITGAEFRVFSSVPRWEVLCVDEGQRLKSDGSLIFNRLKTLNSVHRILLTGTPLNNNLRELFNLLNFLDRDTYKDLADLEARFEDLNEAKVTELHEMIKPFILRRIKADVLTLPPKIEIIVPISLAPLQKNVYKTILERNADLLKAIAEGKERRKKRAVKGAKAEDKPAAAAVALVPAPDGPDVQPGPAQETDANGTSAEAPAVVQDAAEGTAAAEPAGAEAASEPIVVD